MKEECRKVREIICDEYDFNNQQKNSLLSIEEHLKVCKDCKNYIENLKSVILYYQKYELKVDEECSIKILKYLGLYKG